MFATFLITSDWTRSTNQCGTTEAMSKGMSVITVVRQQDYEVYNFI